ncbi:matrix metalloproteinase-14 isoform X1 [Amyelois transitella]|uniref:matrix metalloproteinase-14 isoform X1 n=1 Tax=Amyelois transitella TaxID=680683 RepID=UPI00298F587A|nr:matrix metalloproteinase-14 isoform X1 [Amyelois transitella]XP_013195414.2 matrix metalloproteinase-14 isoform X1 [Amyelois transitella]
MRIFSSRKEYISSRNMTALSIRSSLRILWTVVAAMVFLTRISAAPAFEGGISQATMYLDKFGYLSPKIRNPTSGHIIDESLFRKAVAEFQSFAGLNTTGDLDEETKKMMAMPRCGVRDKVGFGESRAKRYALQGSRWRIKNLTYRIAKYPSRLNHADVDLELAKAFSVWSDYTDLTFTQKRSGQVHIEIRFETGEHGDGDPFDGPGGTLAHAYFPVYGGDAHFDDAETWTINSKRGTNLFQVAAHEFGHSLGLSHSDVRSALMAPFYRGYDPAFQLDQDDIQGIQALYGRKTQTDIGGGAAPAPAPNTPRPSAEDPALCADSKFDTIFNGADGSTFIFKGENYWRLTEDGVASGYPRLISRAWPGLPGNIDAAFTYKNGKTYFFKGSKYWRYNGQKMDGDYPKDISEGFSGIPDNLDAALVWSGNGKIYFYKGSKFWRFDPTKRPPVKATYPKPVSNWEGIPDNIDAALQYTNGYTYFFKGGSYWRFNDRSFSVDTDNPAFPRSTAFWWLGCSSAPRGTVGGNSKYAAYTNSPDEDDVGDIIFDADGEEATGGRESGAGATRLSLGVMLGTSLIATLTTRLFSRV